MKRALLTKVSLCTRNFLQSPSTFNSNPITRAPLLSSSSFSSNLRFFSSENDSSVETPNPSPKSDTVESKTKSLAPDVEDVNNAELKKRIEAYFKGDEEALPPIMEAILRRKLLGKHEDTDDDLMDELVMEPIDNVKDSDFESDFEEIHETDEEIDNLYNARDYVMNKMVKDEYFNMDDKKWDEMIKEATDHKFLKDMTQCEEILEDMLKWDKLLPDEIKQKVEKKFNEIGDRIEKGELEVEEGYALFKEYEDQMVLECMELMDAAAPPQFDDTVGPPDNKKDVDDPPGEGPILRWQTRVVFAPGGDAWHPKNRKVKLAVTVKELGLSKHQFRRLRELVGKRYNPGKDELTITSERFEHREENRKDCLRTLFSLIEEAAKADKLVEEARTAYAKERLKANPRFMERLNAKTLKLKGSTSVAALPEN